MLQQLDERELFHLIAVEVPEVRISNIYLLCLYYEIVQFDLSEEEITECGENLKPDDVYVRVKLFALCIDL